MKRVGSNKKNQSFEVIVIRIRNIDGKAFIQLCISF
jgi:hypothetical protein